MSIQITHHREIRYTCSVQLYYKTLQIRVNNFSHNCMIFKLQCRVEDSNSVGCPLLAVTSPYVRMVLIKVFLYDTILPFKYHVSCTDGKISVRIIYLYFHRRRTHKLCFLSCRPFVVNATLSTDLVEC